MGVCAVAAAAAAEEEARAEVDVGAGEGEAAVEEEGGAGDLRLLVVVVRCDLGERRSSGSGVEARGSAVADREVERVETMMGGDTM